MKEQKLTEIEIGAIDEAREMLENSKVPPPQELRRDTTYSLEREVTPSGSSVSSNRSLQMILTFVDEHPKKVGALVASLILALLLKLNVDPSN